VELVHRNCAHLKHHVFCRLLLWHSQWVFVNDQGRLVEVGSSPFRPDGRYREVA
jgi:hypothetical protein